MQKTVSDSNPLRAYESVSQFARSHNHITYDQFDRGVLKELNLFDVPKEPYFHVIEETLDRIIRTLPAMKHIFAKPLIRLRDTHELRPIETVRIIDNQTLAHVAIHSEIWASVTRDGGIEPRKLMTVENTETYAIYENMVFTLVVDSVLHTIGYMKRFLKDILYGCSDFQFNLLDRTHHRFYFHAIGKLHLEYAQAQYRQYAIYLRCVEKIGLIERTIRAKLHAPVYLKCKKKKKKVTLKKSNAFRTHKDYKQIYLLWKWLDAHNYMEKGTKENESVEQLEYEKFCLFMSIFSIGHFNFVFPEEQTFDFENLEATAFFQQWELTLKSIEIKGVNALVFQIKKDKTYTSCLILSNRNRVFGASLEAFKDEVRADEYLFASANIYGEKDVVCISLYNIDSFRRIQQILLRGMIYSDETKQDCPFCGGVLEKTENGSECFVCRADIRRLVCPDTQRFFYVSDIKKHTFLSDQSEYQRRQEFLHDRFAEAQLHFRNITPITYDGMPICPFCGKEHYLQ